MTGNVVSSYNDDLFEGVEKRIELVFNEHTHIMSSLRSLTHEDISQILDAAKCTILVKKSLEDFDAYILSESSLFVYDYKVIILTCGTTSLLLSVPLIIQKAILLGLTCILCQFTRGDYLFPTNQNYPHTSFEEECKYLDTHVSSMNTKFVSSDNFNSKLYSKSKYIWITYEDVYEDVYQDVYKNLLNIFQKKVYFNIHVQSDYITQIRRLVGKIVDSYDDYIFTPCGYSLNGYKNNDYITIHITPQSACSYVSIEYTGSINIQKYTDEIYSIFHHMPSKIKPSLDIPRKSSFDMTYTINTPIQIENKTKSVYISI